MNRLRLNTSDDTDSDASSKRSSREGSSKRKSDDSWCNEPILDDISTKTRRISKTEEFKNKIENNTPSSNDISLKGINELFFSKFYRLNVYFKKYLCNTQKKASLAI